MIILREIAAATLALLTIICILFGAAILTGCSVVYETTKFAVDSCLQRQC